MGHFDESVVRTPQPPCVVLRILDAREWVADKETPRIGVGLIAGGAALVLLAMLLLTIGSRRRGLSWWQRYTENPSPPPQMGVMTWG